MSELENRAAEEPAEINKVARPQGRMPGWENYSPDEVRAKLEAYHAHAAKIANNGG